MKKVILLVIVFLLTGCVTDNGYTEISYKELLEKLDNQENFVLTIEATGCSYCEKFEKTIVEINKKYSLDIKYIDMAKLNEEEKKYIKSIFPYTGTPTTINIVNGQEENSLSRIEGAKDYSYVKEKLIKWGYIEE